MKWRPFQNHLVRPLIPISLVALLLVWTSLELYSLKFGNLSGGALSFAQGWEGVVVFIPLPGIVAFVYGICTMNRLLAFLVGFVPFSPLFLIALPLETRFSIYLISGVMNGLVGTAGVFIRHGTVTFRAGLTIMGILLLLFAFFWLLFLFSSISG